MEEGMGMNYSLEIEIEKPLVEVAELFGNVENLAFWQPGFLGSKEIDGKTVLTYQHGKREMEMVEEVSVDDLPREFTSTFTMPGMVMTVQNLFEEAGEGRTKWISNNDCTSSGFMKVMMFFIPGCAKKQSYSYMENFKSFAEEGKDVRESTK